VRRAFAELIREGYLQAQQGKGTFVSGASGEFIREEQLRRIEEHLEAAATAAREHDIPEEKLIQLIQLFYKEEPSS
jgi:GntR family transcriptional regulator